MIVYDPGSYGVGFACRLRGSVFPRAFAPASLCTGLAVLLHWSFRYSPTTLDEIGAGDAEANVLGGFTFILGFLVVFRSQQAYSRWWEGGTLLQQLRGEWFNSYSCLIAFCNAAPEKREEVVHFQHQLVRLYSLLYGCALQQVATMDDKNFELFILEGFEEGSLAFLQGSHDRCEITLQWIQRLIVESDSKQILKIAPPILSRVFNELGNGIVNLNNARKITDFPIPFHLAQMITVMLIVHSVMTPVICAATVEHLSWAAIISFVVSFCYWAVHFITIELEMPFGDDWNDLPLQDMATDFNMSLANLIDRRAQEVPKFYFELQKHAALGKKIIDFDRSLSPSTAPAKKKPRASAEKGGRKVPDLEAVDVWRSEDDSIQSGAPVAPPGAPPGAPPPAPPAPPAPVALPTKDSLPEVKAKAKAEGSKAKEAKEEKALLLPELDLKDPDLDLLEKYLQSADFQKRLEGYLAIAVRQLERIAGKPEKPPDPVLQDREMDGPTCVWIPQCLPDEA
ncbi:unnamed protein product [Effrenium voratum]|uniref:Uncharacterized protein n=1 Tax=Effrenium voratum TaxID=2562239 RepID=A0AA36NHV0_9DINO|nr:unnamed protein product [Effrenium voratum]